MCVFGTIHYVKYKHMSKEYVLQKIIEITFDIEFNIHFILIVILYDVFFPQCSIYA